MILWFYGCSMVPWPWFYGSMILWLFHNSMVSWFYGLSDLPWFHGFPSSMVWCSIILHLFHDSIFVPWFYGCSMIPWFHCSIILPCFNGSKVCRFLQGFHPRFNDTIIPWNYGTSMVPWFFYGFIFTRFFVLPWLNDYMVLPWFLHCLMDLLWFHGFSILPFF